MKKLILLAAAVLLLGGGGLFLYREGKEKKGELSSAKKSVLDLLSGKEMECSFKHEGKEIKVWVKGKKVRIEGEEIAGGGEMKKGTMINDGEWVYIWSGKEGMKYNLAQMKEASATGTEETEAPSAEEVFKNLADSPYQCQRKKIPASVFSPPAEVKFQDWGEMMNFSQKVREETEKGSEKVEEKMKELEEKFGGANK